MTKDTERSGKGDAGSRRRRGMRGMRGWILALALIGLGAVGGAATTAAVGSEGHGMWGHHWKHRASNPAEMTEKLQRMSAWALGSVDATDEQRARVDAILAEAVNDLFPLRDEQRAYRRDLIAELSRPQVDRAALDKVRVAGLALAEKATARMLDAVIAVSEVLDQEQRQQLVKRFARHRH